jgi:acyl dehydratase
MTNDDATLMDRLRGMLGARNTPELARDAVNTAMIRHWCDAMTDHNPVYTDPVFAAKSIHGGLVAPPAMLNAWTMPGLPGRSGSGAGRGPLHALDAAGFSSVIATNSEHEYLRYLRPGDLLHGHNELVEVSEAKQTALGLGHFVTSRTSYRSESGEEVGRMFFRLLKFQPGSGRAPSAKQNPLAPSAAQDALARPARRESTLRAAELSVGERLPPCPVPITTTLIVSAAIASRDYQDVHHDRDAAIRRGTPDIFMNILSSSGLVARYVTDWAGPEALLTALRIRLGAPNYPGDSMRLEGRVTKNEAGAVEVAIRGANRLGDHVTGTVELRLP